MFLFILFFLSIYGLMHLMVWWGLRPLLPRSRRIRVILLALTLGMVCAPIIIRVLEHLDLFWAARIWAWVGYLWMGFLWMAFALFVALALWNGIIRLVARVWPPASGWFLRGVRTCLFVVLVVFCAGTYAFFEARWLHTENIVLETTLLPAGRSQLRIVHLSDIHLGLLNRETELAAIIRTVNRQKPDLVVATGDILDAGGSHLQALLPNWHRLNPPLGKIAVIGNHEVYTGIRTAETFLEAAGFEVLNNRLIDMHGMQIAGVSDPARGTVSDDQQALAEARADRFTIFLKHRPVIDENVLGRFDLQLSGHTHRGQIFPFNLLTGLAYPLQDGLYPLKSGSHLYTSRGTGCWGPPMRLFSPPEITVIDIVAP